MTPSESSKPSKQIEPRGSDPQRDPTIAGPEPTTPARPQQELLYTSVQMMKSHSGPLPPPEVLEQYGRVHPDLPAQIIERWRSEQGHRHTQESRIVSAGIASEERESAQIQRGQFLGAAVTLVLACSAVALAFAGATVAATAMCLVIGVGVGAVLITGKNRQEPKPPQTKT